MNGARSRSILGAHPIADSVPGYNEQRITRKECIGLASDDVTKQSDAWQRGKLVLNKDCIPSYKSMLGERRSLVEGLYSFVKKSERFWQLFNSLVHHISIGVRNWTKATSSIGRLPACFCLGCYLRLEPILPVATIRISMRCAWGVALTRPYVVTTAEKRSQCMECMIFNTGYSATSSLIVKARCLRMIEGQYNFTGLSG